MCSSVQQGGFSLSFKSWGDFDQWKLLLNSPREEQGVFFLVLPSGKLRLTRERKKKEKSMEEIHSYGHKGADGQRRPANR